NLRGDLQMHSRWSDGSGTIAEMADAATERSYEYIAITDHSKGSKIAGGINERELARQGAEIAKLNMVLRKSGRNLLVLRSVEMNLNRRGEGDMSPESLLALDLVLGSFHSSLRIVEDQTNRYLAALRNPHIQILGHPRGRIYNFRIGLSADWPRVFAEATSLHKVMDVSCYAYRKRARARVHRIQAGRIPSDRANLVSRSIRPAQKNKGNKMKQILLSMALAVVAPFAWAQVSETTTTTTTTEGSGTITEYTPG